MKIQSRLAVLIILSFSITSHSAFAQKKDHPMVGHLDGAKLWVQNINNIHEYTVITGSIKNNDLVSSTKVVGKTTMTAYKYEGDNSAFGIIHNYTDFLEGNGFEILYSCKSGECGGNISKPYLTLNKIETADNSVSPAFWDASYFRNFLSAKKQENGKTVYVSIFIAQGWWNFPVYRIDVVEEQQATNMILNDNQDQNGNVQPLAVGVAPQNIAHPESKKISKFSFQAGMSSYNFYDPQLYGEDFVIQSNGVYTGRLSGFRDLSGLFVKIAYFFNENIGVSADIALHHGENGNYIESGATSINYTTNADMNFQRIGLVGRFIGNEYPIKLSFNTGIGAGTLDAYYQIKTNNTQIDYEGKTTFPMVFFQTEIIIPIIKDLFVFTQYEYSVGWTDEFSLVHNNGTEYNEILYKYPGMGGHGFRVGLGYEF